MRRDAGFSLIEMMVVLAIVSLAAGVVVMSAPGPSGQLAQETDRLIRSLASARDLALLRNRSVIVELSEAGYETRISGPVGEQQPVEQIRWSDSTTVGTKDGRLPAMIVFDSVGLAEPAQLSLFRDGARDGVVVEASGEIRRLDDGPQS